MKNLECFLSLKEIWEKRLTHEFLYIDDCFLDSSEQTCRVLKIYKADYLYCSRIVKITFVKKSDLKINADLQEVFHSCLYEIKREKDSYFMGNFAKFRMRPLNSNQEWKTLTKTAFFLF